MKYKLEDYEKSLNDIKQKQRKIKNQINRNEGLKKKDEESEELKRHLIAINRDLLKKNISIKQKIEIIQSKFT